MPSISKTNKKKNTNYNVQNNKPDVHFCIELIISRDRSHWTGKIWKNMNNNYSNKKRKTSMLEWFYLLTFGPMIHIYWLYTAVFFLFLESIKLKLQQIELNKLFVNRTTRKKSSIFDLRVAIIRRNKPIYLFVMQCHHAMIFTLT